MESQTPICEREIPLQISKTDVSTASYLKSLESVLARAQETARYQVQLEEVKSRLRDAEADLVKALSVKTRKEAKQLALKEAIASPKVRIEQLKTSIEEQQTKNQHYAKLLSQQSLALAASEGKLNESIEHMDEKQEAISWYDKVLGIVVESGHGVKFTFKNINLNKPNEEYFFTICTENSTYTLLSCEPSLEGTEELIHELNNTNGLFKFVRVMRRKFQEAVAQGRLVLTTVGHEKSVFISASAPVLSMSSVRRDSPTKEKEHQVELTDGDTRTKKQNVRKRGNSALLFPVSASSVRQSPRSKVWK